MNKLAFLFLIFINIFLSTVLLKGKSPTDFISSIYGEANFNKSIKDTTIEKLIHVTQHYLDSTRNLTKGSDSLGAIYTLLIYPFNLIDIDSVEWIYAEIQVPFREAPVHTYYCVIQGAPAYYCGFQVNSKTERRIIFSVWDKNGGDNDEKKVPGIDRAKLLSKGEGVISKRFQNEGSGVHTHLIYNWKEGVTYKFLIHAVPDSIRSRTIISCFFYAKGKWCKFLSC